MITAQIEHPLTDKQKEVVDYKGNEILIKGIAGSGKTTVILRRARKLLSEDAKLKIGLFTYNKTLTKSARLISKVIDPENENLKVHTFHSWAFMVLKSVTNSRYINVSNNRDREAFLEKAIAVLTRNHDHRFLKEQRYKEFLLDEISWIKGKGLSESYDYYDVDRKGRGGDVRVTKKDRELIFKVFQEYETERLVKNKVDYDDFARIISNHSGNISEEYKFDHIMIDEAQDLQQIQLMVLKKVAKKAFVVAADKGQKIYKTSFTWKDIGINIKGGRTKILENSFRSTQQIIKMAHSLQLHDSVIHDEEYVKPILPEYTGPIPEVFQCNSKKEQDVAIVKSIQNILDEYPDATIGILGRQWRSINRLYHSIKGTGIPYEYIKNDDGNIHEPGVKLTTFHSAKGLEFDFVIVIDLIDEISSEKREDQDDEYIEVERRLLYVSITRAKKHLQLFYYDNPSKLLLEIDTETYEKTIL